MFNLTTRLPAYLLIIILLLSIAVSFFYYRRISIEPYKKAILIFLKSSGLFLLLFIIIEPVIKSSRIIENTQNIIFVDDSRSMNFNSFNDKKSSDNITDLINKIGLDKPNFKFIRFGNSSLTNQLTDKNSKLEFNDFETNPDNGLLNYKNNSGDNQPSTITLMSDGNFNSGNNPLPALRSFNCPVVTIGIGDTTKKTDLYFENVYYNRTIFTNTPSHIKANIVSYKIKDKVTISLLRNGNEISKKEFVPDFNNKIQEIDFQITENNAGTNRYEINIAVNKEEYTHLNNTYKFLIRSVEKHTNILFISSGPGYDNSTISKLLKRLKDYTITFKTLKSLNEFYEGSIDPNIYSGLSSVIFLEFPTSVANTAFITNIFENIKNYKIPLLFIAGKNTDYNKLMQISEMLPFIAEGNAGEYSTTPRLTTNENRSDEYKFEFKSLPNLFMNIRNVTTAPGSDVILIDNKNSNPLLLFRNNNNYKSISLLGYGFYKWILNPNSNNEKILEELITKLINISLKKENTSKLQILIPKSTFDYTEDVVFNAKVYDQNNQLINYPELKGQIVNNKNSVVKEFDFLKDKGTYTANIGKLKENDYTIKVNAFIRNEFYDKSEEFFMVDTITTEYNDTRSNYNSLSEISINTGGKFINSQTDFNLADILDSLRNKQPEADKQEFVRLIQLKENIWFLLLIILLFAIEWIIRKRINLA